MDYIWYGADYPSQHRDVVTIYQSLTSNEWLDLLLVAVLLLLPPILIIWNIERKCK